MKFTLRQIEIFLAVAKHSNITLATEQLHMSQSAVSAALQQLEANAGAQLFDRLGKRLKLNKYGQALRTEAESLLLHSLDFENSLQGKYQQGDIDVGASMTIGNYLGINLLAKYHFLHPQAKINFHVANSAEIIAKTLSFELDVGMIEGQTNHDDLLVIPWQEDRLTVFCSPSHPLAMKRVLDDEDILSTKWIMREPESGTHQNLVSALGEIGSQLDVFLQLEHHEAIKRAVEEGLGIGCLSERIVRPSFKSGTLIPLKLKGRDLRRYFYCLIHKQRVRNQSARWWLGLCGLAVGKDDIKASSQ